MIRRVPVFLMLILLSNGTLRADEMRIPENTPRPLNIGVAVFVNNITKVNDQAGTFEGSLDLQLRWNNTDLAFNAQEMGTNRLEFSYLRWSVPLALAGLVLTRVLLISLIL